MIDLIGISIAMNDLITCYYTGLDALGWGGFRTMRSRASFYPTVGITLVLMLLTISDC
jgi:hypothetical protein